MNQVSTYSHSISREKLRGESLSDEDSYNLQRLYESSLEIAELMEELRSDIAEGRTSWRELTRKSDIPFAQQVYALPEVDV